MFDQSLPEKTMVTIAAADGHRLTAWRSDPVGPAKGGVVVLHAVYGLTDHIGDVCALWAGAGYSAIAPALFDRHGPGLVHPYSRAGADAGIDHYARLGEQAIFTDIDASARSVGPAAKVAISGFCTGGTWAWRAAASLAFGAQVNFYGSHVSQCRALTPRCPTIMHYGDSDHIVAREAVARIAAAHPEVAVHHYEGAGHAFFNPAQATYAPEAAMLAWSRSLAFMERHVASGAG